jgi:hypothetical protein
VARPPPVYAGYSGPATSEPAFTPSVDIGNESGEKLDQLHAESMPKPLPPEGIVVTVRLYTACALAVTASAVAGLLVGGFIATADRAPAEPAITQVSQLTPAADGTELPRE